MLLLMLHLVIYGNEMKGGTKVKVKVGGKEKGRI